MKFLWPTLSTAFIKCRIYSWSEKTEGITAHQPNKQIYLRPVQISMQCNFFAYQRKNWCATSNFNKMANKCLTCVAENGLIQSVFLLCSLLCFTKGNTLSYLCTLKEGRRMNWPKHIINKKKGFNNQNSTCWLYFKWNSKNSTTDW